MALTPEQQSQLDFQAASIEQQNAQENVRHANQMALQAANAAMAATSAKLEAIRIAQVTLIENSRSKPADQREVTVEAITSFANALIASTNA
jgi:hemolysin activation/secretion protein